jgi:hypothetical protein
MRFEMTVTYEVEALIARSPGLTEAEIATALFGDAGTQQRISKACASLIKSRRIERSGKGGRTDPFRYFPKGTLSVPSSPTKRSKFAV